MDDLCIHDNLVIPAQDLSWSAVRAGGPGGQHVNKVSTKVELRFDLPGNTTLSQAVKARLRRLAGVRRLDADGRLVLTEQQSRSQSQNLTEALERLRTLISAALVVPKKRKATRPSRAAKRRRLQDKRKLAEKKQRRRHVARNDD
ncbi:MAG: alternative ribosome rescue aminoacyl-tRNA hydrolase ArfB [Polyangiales bacterium]